MPRPSPSPDPRVPALHHAGAAAALVELGAHLAAEVATLVQEVHTVASPSLRGRRRPAAPWVYEPLRWSLAGARWLSAAGGRAAGVPEAHAWLDVRSALNGAFGHRLPEDASALALPMTLQERPGGAGRPRLTVFLHGLCMNERGWRGQAHQDFVDWLGRRRHSGVAYLRYNTGLRISRNGARLSSLLEREARGRELVLIGHSMGGLVALSAAHQARRRGDTWVGRLEGIACLGSPHEGTRLERLANHANRMLAATPWTRPFQRLADLRSDGIRDLRFGHLLDEDWRELPDDHPTPRSSAVALGPETDHLLLAAVRSHREDDPVGDWLVPARSALARRLHPEDAARRALVRELDHIGLLTSERVTGLLRDWLDGRPIRS